MPNQVQETTVAAPAESKSSEVLLLPGHVFFVRRVSLPPGMKAEELDSFVEISLEQMAPFPVNQLFYGYFLPEGADALLLYAAYRKKLAPFTGPLWEDVRLAVPAFVALLGWKHEGAAAVVWQGESELTGVLWNDRSPVPERVISRAFVAGEGDLGELRKRLLEKMGVDDRHGSVTLLEQPVSARMGKKGIQFSVAAAGRPEPIAVELSEANPWALDVRDKGFLFYRRKTDRQNRWIWNLLLLLLFGLLTMGILEIGLKFGSGGLETRQRQVDALVDRVTRIEQELELATRLEELSGSRLLPFEMLSFINQIRPRSIHFTRAVALRGNVIELDAQTRNPQDAERFEVALRGSEAIETVSPDPITPRTVDGRTTFQVQLRFRDDVLAAKPLRQAREPDAPMPGIPGGEDPPQEPASREEGEDPS